MLQNSVSIRPICPESPRLTESKKHFLAIGDDDGDGIPDHLDNDDDNDGIPDHLDDDDDGDGIPDTDEGKMQWNESNLMMFSSGVEF